jgi:uncharacterized protein YndB with AHSA1/START domain
VYGLIRIIAVVIVLIVILFAVIGFTASDETEFIVSEQIGSPVTVVWRTLISSEKTPEWNRQISRVRNLTEKKYQNGTELVIYLRDADQEIEHRVKIVSFVPEKKLVFLDIPQKNKPLLRNFQREYQLKSLLDGSTELSVTIKYNAASFITRIFDRLYLRGSIMNMQRRELLELKRYIENL